MLAAHQRHISPPHYVALSFTTNKSIDKANGTETSSTPNCPFNRVL